MKIIGIILIIAGIAGFIFGGITYSSEETVADIGPLEVQTEQEKSIPITPLASGAAVLAGIALVVVDSRNKS